MGLDVTKRDDVKRIKKMTGIMPQDKIVDTAYRVLRGSLRVPTKRGWCLAFVRVIIEQTFDMAPGEFYERWVDPYFTLNNGEKLNKDISPRWARGAERAMRASGIVVATKAMEPGDLIFSYRVSKPYGHVALLMPGKLVLENTYANRGWRHPDFDAVRLTPLREWDPVTTVIRIPEGR